jgi:Glyoxalase/Bleomycin resistance protein/Dioxygenase superfamily
MLSEPEEVDELADRARRAGGTLTKEPVDAEFFVGRDAYFSDPEGNYWEIAWAPPDNPGCRRLAPCGRNRILTPTDRHRWTGLPSQVAC